MGHLQGVSVRGEELRIPQHHRRLSIDIRVRREFLVQKNPEGGSVKVAPDDGSGRVHQEHPGGLEHAVKALPIGRDFRIPYMRNARERVPVCSPCLGRSPHIDGKHLQRIFPFLDEGPQPGGLHLAGRARSIIKVNHRPPLLSGHAHRSAGRVFHRQHGRLGTDERRLVEFRKQAGVEVIPGRFHGDFSGKEPILGDMHGHGIVSHHLGLEIVVVNLERHVLAHQGILRGGNEVVALSALHLSALSEERHEILLQFGPQFRIGFLCPGSPGQNGRHDAYQPLFHRTTPSGIKAE